MRIVIFVLLFFFYTPTHLRGMKDEDLDRVIGEVLTKTEPYFNKDFYIQKNDIGQNIKQWLIQSKDYKGEAFHTTVGMHMDDQTKKDSLFFHIFCTVFSDLPKKGWNADDYHVQLLTNLTFNLPQEQN